MKALFRGKHYVALYRTSDNSVPPVLALSDLELLQTRSFAESEFKVCLGELHMPDFKYLTVLA